MNEHSFVKSLHTLLKKAVYHWKIHDTYTGGVPDAMYAGPTGILFVEYKYVKSLPARDDTEIKTTLSALQKGWLNMMCKNGHQVAVVIGCELSAVILEQGRWNTPLTKAQYLDNAVSRKDVVSWIKEKCQ